MDRLRVCAFSRPSGFVAAARNGAFASEGLEIEYTRATGSTPQIRALLAGELELVHTNADNVMAWVDRDGADLIVVLVAELGIGQKLVVRPEITSIGELRGRTVGVDAIGSGYAFVLYKLLRDAGVEREDCRIESIGGTAERAIALAEGRIDGALVSAPYDARALDAGCRVLAAGSSVSRGLPALTVAARRTWASANRDVVSRYCRALLAGVRWAAEPRNRDAVIELLRTDLEVDRAAAEAYYERERADREAVAPHVRETREALARTAALRREFASLSGDLDRYFDSAYALAADPSLA